MSLFYGGKEGPGIRGCKSGGTRCRLRAARPDVAPIWPAPLPHIGTAGCNQRPQTPGVVPRGLGMGGACSRDRSQTKTSPPFLCRKDRGATKYDPLVKRLRHRPFTAAARVRLPYGSPEAGSRPADVGVAESPQRKTMLAENCRLSDVSGPVLPGVSGASHLRRLVADKAGWGSLSGNRPNMLPVAQLVRAPDCDPGGRGFEPRQAPHAPIL